MDGAFRARLPGDVAQLGECGVRNAEVEGSIPFVSTSLIGTTPYGWCLFCWGKHERWCDAGG